MDLAPEKFELADVDSLALNYMQFKSLENDQAVLFHHSDSPVPALYNGSASHRG
jgi:hypothetical protein